MGSTAQDPQPDTRALEVVLDVAPAIAPSLLDPARLGEWLVSRADVDDDQVRLCVEEEYGYRRHVTTQLLARDATRLRLQVERSEREWDGSDGSGVGPALPPSRWHEPEFDGTSIELVLEDGLLRASWRGFRHDAMDATRRVGTLLRWAVERAVESHGAGALHVSRVERRVAGDRHAAWAMLGSLVAEPGARWTSPDGTCEGRVLVSVSGRRLASSWQRAGTALPHGLLDVRIGHERDDGTPLDVTLRSAAETDADRVARLVDDLVAATSGVAADA
jgi:hypothetical protein